MADEAADPPASDLLVGAVVVALCLVAGVLVALLLRERVPVTATPPAAPVPPSSVGPPTTRGPAPPPDLTSLPDAVRPCVEAAFASSPPAGAVDLASDPAVVVCTKTTLTTFLQDQADATPATAACAADAVVDALGLPRTLALLAGATPPADAADRIAAALATC